MASFIDPFQEVRRMQRDINRMFNDVFGGGFGGSMAGGFGGWPALGGAGLGALTDVTPSPTTTLATVGPGVGVTDVALPSDVMRDLAFWPKMDIKEEGNDLVLSAELPGVNKEDLKVEFDNGVLRLSGERKREVKQEGENWFRQERSFGKFNRAFRLPHPVREENIEAKFQNGVLQVRVPQDKPSQAKGHAINIM
jgi:HSP20 family protein